LLLGLEARRAAGVFWAFLGTAIIGGLGSYKLLVALLKGKSNVIFLIIMGVVAVVLLLKLCNPPRLTHRGRRYLTQLQSSFRSLKEDFEDGCAPQTGVLFLVGLFGMDALAHTAYAGHRDLFAKASAGGGSGGCGGGCGSCSGGLRCLSLAINGDPFTADPGCWHSVGRRAARGSCEERTGPTEGLQRNVRHSGFEEKIATGR
jgi:hypothetical protein